MEGCAELVCQATPKFFDANMFREVEASFQLILNENNQADFFKLRMSGNSHKSQS
jgi:hypothetical protein